MTAQDLLHKLLEYNRHWTRKHLVKEKPSVVRRQQIESLLDAFGLSKQYVDPSVQIKYSRQGEYSVISRAEKLSKLTNIEYVMHGEFLKDSQYAANTYKT